MSVRLTRAHVLVSSLLAAVVAVIPAAPAAAVTPGDEGEGTPLRQAHAHNDYEHQRPLLDALEHGFSSVEVDVWLVDGELLVGHDREDLVPERTISSLYLRPLADRVRANDGDVFTGHDQDFQLLIDIKNTGVATYRALHRELRDYRGMLSTYAHHRVKERAVTAVVSGERSARVPMQRQRVRHAFYDGRFADLSTDTRALFMPLVSDSWSTHFSWQGDGPMPAEQRAKLHAIVKAAHARGHRVRFWATPDLEAGAREAVWRELVAADVDHINSDHLDALEDFLRELDEPADRRAA